MKRAILLGALALVMVTTSAHADNDADARAAMQRGVSAFGRGDAAKALEEYETAKRLVPQANAPWLYAAEALIALARYPEAVANLEVYLEKSPNVSDAADVRARIARIKREHFPARVTLTVEPPDAVVSVDGTERGQVRSLELAPGHYRIEARAAGRAPASREVDVVGATEQTVTLALELAKPTPPDPMPPPAPPVDNREATIWPTVGWVTTAVGGTMLLASVVVDLAVLGPKVSDYRTAASRGDASARDLRDDASGLQGLTLAGYVAGGVITAAGVGVLLFAPRTTAAERPATGFFPMLGSGVAGLGFRGAL